VYNDDENELLRSSGFKYLTCTRYFYHVPVHGPCNNFCDLILQFGNKSKLCGSHNKRPRRSGPDYISIASRRQHVYIGA
jgi:hypothetical protein